MEQHVLSLLENISLSDNNILNGSLFTCKDDDSSLSPCLTCISCKLMLVLKFCVSLLNHMTDQEIVAFVLDCIGNCNCADIADVLDCLLSPLGGKDRIYSQSRARPSLSTDLMDLSLKNHTVNHIHLHTTTSAIAAWIVNQRIIFKSQFLVSLFSQLKLAVLAEIHRTIYQRVKSNEVRLPDYEQSCKTNGFISTNRGGDPNTIKHHIDDTAIDFISLLPVHISKFILNLLDEESLKLCSGICNSWKMIVSQVRKEDIVNQKIKEQSMLLQEVSTKPVDASYAKDADVQVPRLKPGGYEVMYADGFDDLRRKRSQKRLSVDNSVEENPIPVSREIFNMDTAFKNVKTKTVIMEERNVYCGAYSVLLVMEGLPKQSPPATRTISFNSGDLISVGGSNKIIQFLDIEGRMTNLTKTKIHGHAGSIKVLRIIKRPGETVSTISSSVSTNNSNDVEVLSGSYDTTIRRWDISSGKCVKIYIGHSLTITTLDVAETTFASGSMDGTCKLWNYDDGNCILSMRHKCPVTAVAISNKLFVSGDQSGLVKVWNINNGNLLKNLIGHSKDITAVRVDSFHILSASLDCYVLLWSSMGDLETCIGCFRHPKPVLCLEMVYMRAVTAGIDGRIRIWNTLTGQCIRIIRGNSKSDPILTMVVNDNRIIINTISNILVLNFETVDWIYDNDEKPENPKQSSKAHYPIVDKISSPCKHSYQRYERARFAGNIDPRLFLSPVTIKNEVAGRQFEDGILLTRSSTWLVTPSLTRPIRLEDKISRNLVKEPSPVEEYTEGVDVLSKDENETRATTTSSSERRISYGFERQDHLTTNIELQGMKKLLRTHIRSRPVTAAQAMPDFVKTMVMQMRESATTGRPISAFSSNNITRRSSGPHEVDLRSKSSAEEIKNSLRPTIPKQPETNQTPPVTTNSAQKHKSPSTMIENLSKPNIISSAKYFSNRSVVDNFLTPKDYKQHLLDKKSEFDKRHRCVSHSSDHTGRGTQHNMTMATNLNLQTFDRCQDYLRKVNEIQTDYNRTKVLLKESERYDKWLRKATDLPCPIYEKDVIMKRPRSAKM